MRALTSQRDQYQELLQEKAAPQVSEQAIQESLQSRLQVPSLSVSGNGRLFLTTKSKYGFEVWRMDREMGESIRVLQHLRGCCGRMDVFATDEHLMVADNTAFRVGIYNHDGHEISSFGKKSTDVLDGFGSCCNPMNVIVENGQIVTAESSVGWLKRFDREGNLVQLVGKAEIDPDCKRAAIGYLQKTDVYLMQYDDKNKICVLTRKQP